MQLNKFVLLGFTTIFPYFLFAQEVKVKVQHGQTAVPIHGAKLTVQGQSFSTGFSGTTSIQLKKLPAQIITSYIGFKSDTTRIQSLDPIEISLMPQSIALHEVDIYAAKNEVSKVKHNLSAQTLSENKDRSLAELLQHISGVEVLRTGSKIGKPVINGLYGNRIAIITDGIKLESQQWGNDHAPEIDVQLADQISVIKGAESLRYGAEALAGIVIIEPKAWKSIDRLSGQLGLSYSSNGQGIQPFVNIQGLTPIKNLKFRSNFNYGKAGNQKAPSYYLNNTGYENYNANLALNYAINKSNIELAYSHFFDKTGILSATHIGDIPSFYERLAYGRPFPAEDLGFSYQIDAPRQQVRHQTLKALYTYQFTDDAHLELKYAFQNNVRQEYDKRRAGRSAIPSMDMDLKTQSLDLIYHYHTAAQKMQVGLQGNMQVNNNNPGTFNTPLIPNYDAYQLGVFGIYNRQLNRLNYEFGLRYDYRYFDAAGIDRYGEAYGSTKKFHNISGNIGINYHIDNHTSLTSNLGLAWRAPSAQELYSQNIHQSTARYERGNPDLIAEKGLKWVNGIRIQEGKNFIQFDLFANYIKDYIYVTPSGDFLQNLAGTFPIWEFKQDDAFIGGLDIQAFYELSTHVEYSANISTSYARNIEQGTYLPLIPPFSLKHELRWKQERERKFINRHHIGLANELYAKQFLTSAINELAPAPSAYGLINLNLSAGHKLYTHQLTTAVSVDNLLNTTYKSYTDLFRYYSLGLGRNIKISLNYTF